MFSTVKGTPPYMAPELLTHERGSAIQLNHRASDMWSLGEMAHRMLTATATFSSQTALFRYMIWPDSLPFEELARHGVGGDVESFIRALMRPTPEHRLTSKEALEHAWIQPCRPPGGHAVTSRTSTPAYAMLSSLLPPLLCPPSCPVCHSPTSNIGHDPTSTAQASPLAWSLIPGRQCHRYSRFHILGRVGTQERLRDLRPDWHHRRPRHLAH